MTRRISTRALVGHHLRSRAGGGITVAALVLILALLATAAPVALSLLGDATLRERIAVLGPLERDVETNTPGLPQLPESEAPADTRKVWGAFGGAVEDIRATAPAPLPALLGDARAVSLVGENPLLENPRTQALTLAFDAGYDDEIRIVEGRLPETSTPAAAEEGSSPPIEIVLSQETARQLEWPVGQTRTIGPSSGPAPVVLTGIFDPVDPAGDYWQHVPSVVSPNVFDDGNGPRRVTGTGFAHPASLPRAASLPGRASTLVWYPLDVSLVQAGNADQTAAALRKFSSVSHAVGSSAQGIGILSLRFTADAVAAVEEALAQQKAGTGVIAMVIAGPVGVAVAVLILGCRLILERRRSSLRLLSARGASAGQLRALLGLEGLVVGVLPALAGAAIALAIALLKGVAPQPAWFAPAVILGLAPFAILSVLAASAAERQARADLGGRGGRLRLVAEGLVVGLAVVALVLLFVRGYSGSVDALLAATPLLLSLVACLVTLRLYPYPLRALLARARRAPGLDAFLGAARTLREPSIGLTPVLALVVGVSVAVSSGVLLSALQAGTAESARAQVGADMNITGATFTLEQLAAVRGLDGVAAATGISGAEPATLNIGGVKRPTSVFVVDAEDLRDVQGERPGMLPPGVSLQPGRSPVAMVAAAPTAEAIHSSADIELESVAAIVAGVSIGPVPIGGREDWVAIDSASAEQVLGRDPSDRTLLVRLAPSASAAAVADELRETLGASVRIRTADEIADQIESGPAVQGVRLALLAATGVAALLSALALVMTLTLAAPARRRVIALLRTLGAPPRSATSLALWEVGPPSIAAVIAGTVFGALVPLVVLGGVDLRSFTGSSVQPGYHVDAATLGLTLGGFLVLAAVFTFGALLASRRVRAGSALRTVEEG